MNTYRKKIFNLYCRIWVICLTALPILGLEAYALDNQFGVISPYWQSDSSSYSFIAVTHPSLDDMASQIGLKINAIQSDKAAFNTAASFTISAGSTQRVFIVRTGHSIVNPTIVPSGIFIVGTTDYTYGNITIEPIASHSGKLVNAPVGAGYGDVTMLHFFGGIIFDAATTGFAMEFIGDTHDSQTTFHTTPSAGQTTVASGVN